MVLYQLIQHLNQHAPLGNFPFFIFGNKMPFKFVSIGDRFLTNRLYIWVTV